VKNRSKLLSLGVKLSNVSGGCCNKKYTTTAYILPVKLDLSILSFFVDFGNASPSFEKTSLLKIDTPNFTITGIRMISQIRLIIKIQNGEEIIDKFEEKLIEYIESKKK